MNPFMGGDLVSNNIILCLLVIGVVEFSPCLNLLHYVGRDADCLGLSVLRVCALSFTCKYRKHQCDNCDCSYHVKCSCSHHRFTRCTTTQHDVLIAINRPRQNQNPSTHALAHA